MEKESKRYTARDANEEINTPNDKEREATTKEENKKKQHLGSLSPKKLQ